MIYDALGLFSDSQAITATAPSTNTIDLKATGTPYGGVQLVRDIGKGECLNLSVTVNEAFNNLTSLTISVETDDNSAFSSAATVFTTPAIPLASLVLGYSVPMLTEFPEGTKEQYVRLKYTVAGTAPTTGKITAGVVAARQTNFVGGQ